MALYPLSATYQAKDVIGGNTPGIIHNVIPAVGPFNQSGNSLSFIGAPNSFIEFPNNGRLDTRRSITCLVWVFNEGRGGTVFQYNPKGQGVGLKIIGANQIEARIVSRRGTKNIPVRTPKKAFKPRTWTYIGFSYDFTLGIVKMYVNGKPVVTKVIGRMELLTNRPARAGSTRRGRRFFRGRMSCIQIYSRALSVYEISTVKTRCFKGGMMLRTLVLYSCHSSVVNFVSYFFRRRNLYHPFRVLVVKRDMAWKTFTFIGLDNLK